MHKSYSDSMRSENERYLNSENQRNFERENQSNFDTLY